MAINFLLELFCLSRLRCSGVAFVPMVGWQYFDIVYGETSTPIFLTIFFLYDADNILTNIMIEVDYAFFSHFSKFDCSIVFFVQWCGWPKCLYFDCINHWKCAFIFFLYFIFINVNWKSLILVNYKHSLFNYKHF